MATGDLHKFGTLYRNDTEKIKIPNYPWYKTPSGAPCEGDIHHVHRNGDEYQIKDSCPDDSYLIRWIEINDNNEKLFISDRNLLGGFNPEEFYYKNAYASKGSGEIITIDGSEYELFVLSGGSGENSDCEWNKYIVNTGNFPGLPYPSSVDNDVFGSEKFFSPHNNVWHWAGCYSACCEINGYKHVCRGSSFVKSWTESVFLNDIGWRPVLKLLKAKQNSLPVITPDTKDFGNLTRPIDIEYTISDSDNDNFNVVVKLDEVQKESYQNQTDKSYTFNMSTYWSSIGLGNHTVKIIATDINGDSTEASYTFNRTNASPTISPAYSSLGELSSPRDITYTVNDPENDSLTIVVKVDNNEKERYTNQSNGQRTFMMSKYWGTLGIGSHEVKIEVTDIFAHKAVATYNFIKKNTTPDPPRVISPLNNSRVGSDFYVEFYIGNDPEGDTQSVAVQVCDNTSWSGTTVFETLEKYANGQWVEATSASNADINTKFRIKVTGITKDKYFRIVSLDHGSKMNVHSSAIHVKFGSVLEVKTHPTETSACIQKTVVLLDIVADTKVKKEIFVSNNANDASPVWEVYTPDSAGNHTFSNKTKTASKWAVSTKLKLTANDSTGEIAVRAIGMGVI